MKPIPYYIEIENGKPVEKIPKRINVFDANGKYIPIEYGFYTADEVMPNIGQIERYYEIDESKQYLYKSASNYIYKDIQDFYNKNPNCCTFYEGEDQYQALYRKHGLNKKFVAITYDLLTDQSAFEKVTYRKKFALNNCGYAMSIYWGLYDIDAFTRPYTQPTQERN